MLDMLAQVGSVPSDPEEPVPCGLGAWPVNKAFC